MLAPLREEGMAKKEVTDYSKFVIERQRGGWVVHFQPNIGGSDSTGFQHKTFDEAVAFIKENYET
jgi:hypothetical protein